jgi:hypothetical protein
MAPQGEITMKKKWVLPLIFACGVIYIVSPIFSARAEENQPKTVKIKILKPEEWPIIKTSGRLSIEKQGNQEYLIFQAAADGQLYTVRGKFTDSLKDLLSSLGKDNIVSIVGEKGQRSVLSCSNNYSFDDKGNKKVESKCFAYYDLQVIKFSDARQSKEALPSPKRDTAEEAKIIKTTPSDLQGTGMLQYITIAGAVIESLNLRSPIKAMVISYKDKNGEVIKKTLLINTNIRIVKKNAAGSEERNFTDVGINSLEEKQEITVIFIKDELKSEAVVITITKEAK